MTDNKIKSFCLIASATFGILIQIQASFMAERSGYLGLRLNLADLMLPIAGSVVLFTLARKTSIFPRWIVRGTWLWLIGLSIIIIAALLNGHAFTGEWSRWAMINKVVGWFVVVAYFCLGGWLSTNAGASVRDIFLRWLTLTFCLIAVVSLGILFLNDFGLLRTRTFTTYPLEGLMGNRNAFALLTACVFIAAAMKDFSGHGLLPRALLPFLSFLLSLLFIEIGSRTGWIVTIVALCSASFLYPKKTLTRIVPYIAAGIAVLILMHSISGKPMLREKQLSHASVFIQATQQNELFPDSLSAKLPEVSSEVGRARFVQDSIPLWMNNPLFGVGLGTYLTTAHRKYDGTKVVVNLIDSTPLWLLTETGVVGLSLFSAFYAAALWALWQRRKTDSNALSMILILIAFALMSVMHEILLTRFIWFMLGLSLAQSHFAPENAKTPATLEH